MFYPPFARAVVSGFFSYCFSNSFLSTWLFLLPNFSMNTTESSGKAARALAFCIVVELQKIRQRLTRNPAISSHDASRYSTALDAVSSPALQDGCPSYKVHRVQRPGRGDENRGRAVPFQKAGRPSTQKYIRRDTDGNGRKIRAARCGAASHSARFL